MNKAITFSLTLGLLSFFHANAQEIITENENISTTTDPTTFFAATVANNTIPETGFVGIGTTNPAALFNVRSTTTIAASDLGNAAILIGSTSGLGLFIP